MGDDPTTQLALLRLGGEITIKAPATRRQFVNRLLRNLGDALLSEGAAPSIRRSHDRIFVEFPALDAGPISGALSRVFGLQSLSLVERRDVTSLDEIVGAGVELFRDAVRGRRFAVRARRVGNRQRIPSHSGDVERQLGAALLPLAARVDLDHPEVTVHVEILEGEVYFFPSRISGTGGMPLGTGGRALALLSGGFDSAVAAWQMQKRGVGLDYVFCNLGGRTHEQGVLRVAKLLADRWSYGEQPRLHAVDFEPISAELKKHTTMRYWQVLLKRQMLRVADRIGDERDVVALVTGEAVAQVSSQTLQNLAVISAASARPVLRPLVGFNKDEIIALAERIGTFELSKVVGEYCAMVSSKPATAASEAAILEEEAKLDASLLDAAVASRSVHDLRKLDTEAFGFPDLEVTEIPEGATVIDLRSKNEFASWHVENALHLEFSKALHAFPSFDASQHYVLYCEIGLKSAHLAELMREHDLDAHHIRGGIRTLRKAAAP